MQLIDLPPELLDAVISEIDSPKHLLRLALSCKLFHRIVIPHHIYTRSLSFHRNRASIVTLVSQLPVYASRFRILKVTSAFTPYHVMKSLGLYNFGSTITENDEDSLGVLLGNALPQFTNMEAFIWDTSHAPTVGVLQALRQAPRKIRTLVVKYHYSPPEAHRQYELLQEISSHFSALHHVGFLRGSRGLSPGSALDATEWLSMANWPYLRSFTLGGCVALDRTLETFFARHPTIEHLDMQQLRHITYPTSLRSLTVAAPPTIDCMPLNVQGVTYLHLPMPSRPDIWLKVAERMPNITVLKCGTNPSITWNILRSLPQSFPNLTKLHLFIRIGSMISLERLCTALSGLPQLKYFASVVPNTEERPLHTVEFAMNRIASRAIKLEFLHIGPDGRDHRLRPDLLHDWYRIYHTRGGSFGMLVEPGTDGVTVDAWDFDFNDL